MPQALIELHYLPSIQYFCKLLQYPQMEIEQEENYQKGSYRNRCRLAAANGPLTLSIPLDRGKNERQNIREVKINYRQDWQAQHWRSIQSAYGKSPFFEHYVEELAPFYQQPIEQLFAWNRALLECFIELLGLSVQLEWSTQYQTTLAPDQVDLRNTIQARPSRQVADPHFQALPYPQVFLEKSGFLPNLSILDLLFCMGPQATFHLEECLAA